MSDNHGKPFCLKIGEQYVPGLVEIKDVLIAKQKPGLLEFCCLLKFSENIKFKLNSNADLKSTKNLRCL